MWELDITNQDLADALSLPEQSSILLLPAWQRTTGSYPSTAPTPAASRRGEHAGLDERLDRADHVGWIVERALDHSHDKCFVVVLDRQQKSSPQ